MNAAQVIIGKLKTKGALDELRRVTPRDGKGRLKHRLFQRLTEEVGHPKLREHLASVTALMKASDTWDGFQLKIDRALPSQIRLPLSNGLEPTEPTEEASG
jgi:hypothetical protein